MPLAEQLGITTLRPDARCRADRRADADADKDKTRLARIEAACLLEDDRDDAEETVAIYKRGES